MNATNSTQSVTPAQAVSIIDPFNIEDPATINYSIIPGWEYLSKDDMSEVIAWAEFKIQKAKAAAGDTKAMEKEAVRKQNLAYSLSEMEKADDDSKKIKQDATDTSTRLFKAISETGDKQLWAACNAAEMLYYLRYEANICNKKEFKIAEQIIKNAEKVIITLAELENG